MKYLLPLLLMVLSLQSQAADPKNKSARQLLERAIKAASQGKRQDAVKLADGALKKDPKLVPGYYFRGGEHFQLGHFKESLRDFDTFIKLAPREAPSQWKRGITCYYAREYQLGEKQFELYQTFHNNDVENSVWRYLCMVPNHGVKKARATMLPIRNDRRVPMMQIYDMFRGKKTVEQVLEATKQGKPDKVTLGGRMFYARLYIGLYYESLGKAKLAEKYLRLAADKHKGSPRIHPYMWAVARVHVDNLDRLKKEEKGFQPLFNGRDLQGWVVMGKKEGWQVTQGRIRSVAGNGGNWLRSQSQYGNFVLRVEWRVSKGGNSGVFVRSKEKGAPWTTGYEIQITNPKQDLLHCTGSLYSYSPVIKRPDESANRWHEFEVTCRGGQIQIKSDGVVCVKFDQASSAKTKTKPLTGFVGLQDAHAPKGNFIEYRNIRIKPLD